MALEPCVELRTGDPQQPGGGGSVACGTLERACDQIALDIG
jgi:hypothetical protein